MPRVHPPSDPVALHFDGGKIIAHRGEPAAIALVAAGHLGLARSPKFHRPRGPACLRAGCDGCLARVDDVPNVMTCRVPAADGMRIETQNVVGSSATDLLRATDWFFPDGMNHHELFVGVPGARRVLQALARRVAGLGKLPKEARGPRGAKRRRVDVLVVGSGPGGMAAALEFSKRRRSVEVIDDDLRWGGGLRGLGISASSPWHPLWNAFGDSVAASRVAVRLRTTAAAVYGDDVLVACESGVEVVTARTLVLAPGAHDGAPVFEGNDVPGVMSARAGAWMASYGVVPGKRVVIAVADGGGPFAEACAHSVPGSVMVRGTPVRVRGSSRIKEVSIAIDGDAQRFACDALLMDGPRAPAYELCAQAGADLVHDQRGYTVMAPGGKIRDGVYAVGEVVGTPLEFEAVTREATAIAESG
jgi:2Fe-2S iron-sulfur cluster protein/pyridine nucleotide-disulfide oxidoreductase